MKLKRLKGSEAFKYGKDLYLVMSIFGDNVWCRRWDGVLRELPIDIDIARCTPDDFRAAEMLCMNVRNKCRIPSASAILKMVGYNKMTRTEAEDFVKDEVLKGIASGVK